MYAPIDTHRRSPRFSWSVILIAAWGFISVGSALAEPGAPRAESWYRVELGGQPAGWVMESTEERDGERISASKMFLELSRGANIASLEMESRFVETSDGRPVSAWSRQKLGALPIESTYEFREEGVLVRHLQASASQGEEPQAREELQPKPEGKWLTPGQVKKRLREELAKGAETFSFRTLDPLLGLVPVTTEWILESRDQEVLTGRGPFRTTRFRQTQSYAPQVATTVYTDAEGHLVRSETFLMGLAMTLTLADRAAIFERPTEAPEILVRSFIRPDRPIERPRQARRAVYEIVSESGALPELPSVGAQSVKSQGSKALVTVDLDAGSENEPEDPAAYLRSTTYLPHDDPQIRALLVDALEGRDPSSELERAEALRAFVARYLVKKDLNTVLGTAVEVAATRSGDCTEHSVLLAALLRGAGIPARVVSGLIYVESFAGSSEIFGFHMWTQAWIEGRWIDFDATLPRERFDAAHIAITTASLDGEETALSEMARVLPLMGEVRIRVLKVEHR